jgi:hypothetical protein
MSDEEKSTDGTIGLAMICLETPVPPEANALQSALDALGEGPSIENAELSDQVLSFDFDGAMGFVSLMPAPLPWSDLEGPCETAWYWPEATETLKTHGAHWIVSLTGNPGTAIERNLRLTRLVAAAAEASGALGIYWGSAPLVQPRAAFVETAKEAGADNLPLELWVEQRLFSNGEGTLCVYTAGMSELGVMEIEVRDTALEATEVMELVYGISQYLVLNGNVINDGDTVGQSAEQKIKARHVNSDWERPGKVLLLQLDSA